jgi:hypothetical protein
MAAQVEAVVTTLNVTHLDFDIESNELTNSADYNLTAQALAQVRSWGNANGTPLTISYTIPVLPTGLTQSGVSVLDASTVESYAAQQGIALLSFWSEGRDNGGCPGQTSASSTCSGLSQSTGAFTQAFQAFTSGGSSGGGGGGTPTPTPTPTPSPTGGSCAATWNNATAYISGNQVSYDGDDWTANQWNYDQVPGGAAGAWNNDGPC